MKSFISYLFAAALVVGAGEAANAQTPITFDLECERFGTVTPSDRMCLRERDWVYLGDRLGVFEHSRPTIPALNSDADYHHA